MKNNRWRAIAKEIELDPSQDPQLLQTLKAVTMESDLLSHAPMPAGYEDHLIRALRAKLPLVESKKPAAVGLWTRIFATFQMPQFRLQAGAAMGFAALALVISFNLRQHGSSIETSMTETMLIETAKGSDVESVDTWISSISSSVTLTQGRDIASLTHEITKDLNADDQKRVLNSFAGEDGDI